MNPTLSNNPAVQRKSFSFMVLVSIVEVKG